MDKQLFIPNKLKVGFQERKDTFTGQLAYVIYYDLKGVLRKEKSWESWCDKNIEPKEFTNEPLEGFVLNKKVGGYKSHWNYRQAYTRVFDPRGFEFEITVENLLYILEQCDCYRGKGLEGKFVYAWDGTELVLLPSSSEEYKQSQSYTVLQNKVVKAKDLVAGASYLTKKQETLIYLGRFDYWDIFKESSYDRRTGLSKKYIFWDGKKFVDKKDLKHLAATIETSLSSNLADLIDTYYKSPVGSKIIELFTKEKKDKVMEANYYSWGTSWVYKERENVYTEFRSRYSYNEGKYTKEVDSIVKSYLYSLNAGTLEISYCSDSYHNPKKYINKPTENTGYYSPYSSTYRKLNYEEYTKGWIEPTNLELWARLESGSVYEVTCNGLVHQSKNTLDEGDDNGEK